MKVLYISYDGMTDPLGQSQVLPYLIALSKYGHQFTILSFEKKTAYEKYGDAIRKLTQSNNIVWIPLSFSVNPPLLSKLYDMIRMRNMAFRLHRRENFDMVHCRSYTAADIGMRMKMKTGVKFFFDMRGFWADEKKDGGAWPSDHPLFKRVYRYYKQKEAEYLQKADHIISLTKAGEREMRTWAAYNHLAPVTIIPCCADMEHFTLTDSAAKTSARHLLKIKDDSFVVSYLGSIGAWYMLEEMLEFFTYIKKEYTSAVLLFVSYADPAIIKQKAAKFGIEPSDIFITTASRQQVPVFMKASDLTLSFIKPVYSKISSSPTKLGEVLSMGIPVITNKGVGDVEEIINETKGGFTLQQFSDEEYRRAVTAVPDLIAIDPARIREKAAVFFDLKSGVELYRRAYAAIGETINKA